MITVMVRTKFEKIPKLYQVFDCSPSVEGGGGRVERIYGVCLSVRRIYPKPESEWVNGYLWINDYDDIMEVLYNSRKYDFKKVHDAEMFYNAIATELALEGLN